ncbi:hypothetical protein FXO37_22006 [Capsicum annuum]|nr:hypothetical protein FXO37_22006 [Capsicum annuum]
MEKQNEEEEHDIDKKQNEEEHHIDKKQKTKEHQQDAEAVKAPKRRVKKLSHKDNLDASMGVGYYLNLELVQVINVLLSWPNEFWGSIMRVSRSREIPPVLPACPGRFPHLAKDDVETRLILTKRQYRKMDKVYGGEYGVIEVMEVLDIDNNEDTEDLYVFPMKTSSDNEAHGATPLPNRRLSCQSKRSELHNLLRKQGVDSQFMLGVFLIQLWRTCLSIKVARNAQALNVIS